jgi:transposase
MCEARRQRGILIAAVAKLVQKGKAWIVPSQSGNGKYTVVPDPQSPFCSCPDFESTGQTCKHLYAVEIVIKRETTVTETETTTTRTVTITETVKKPTYAQNWPAYNAAQTNEKRHFQILLRDLCQNVSEPILSSKGRPPFPINDALFACIYKIYSTFSGRRFMTDMTDALANGFVSKCMSYNSIFRYLENPALTPILTDLIVKSSLPLKEIEDDFAFDSSGFTSSKFTRWFDVKYGKFCEEHTWVKAHIAAGTKTHIVTAVSIYDKNTNDSPIMPELLAKTAENFTIRQASADKQYASEKNFQAIASYGAEAYIKFRVGTTGSSGGLFQKAFHYFSLHREEFLERYHHRSNVESVFSAVKRKFSDSVRSKSEHAMKNEVLCKLLCHNLTVLIHEMYESGLDANLLSA